MLANVRTVLVETSHPGNIGAAARALKNMGLQDLVLVQPRQYPSAEATSRASGANDLLQRARVVATLDDAIGDCGLVVATSARSRHLPWETQEPRELAREVAVAAARGRVAIVFGPERVGLSNADLALCNRLVTIPTDPSYASLNLAMAVQILAYEIHLALRSASNERARGSETPLATAAEMERLFVHLERVMALVEFGDRTGGGHLMARIRRLFNRAVLDQNEYNILRGILASVESYSGVAADVRVERASR